MKTILNLFWQICLLRQSPAYVPTYGWFVGLVVGANVVSSAMVAVAFDATANILQALTSIIVGQTTTAVIVLLVLSMRNMAPRFVTTITALFGCDLIITACAGLVLPLATQLGPMAVSLVFLAFLIWSVAVSGYIMHRAVEVQLAIGVGIAMGMSLMSVMFSQIAIGA
jgi:archaellum biogenesis protein FlaJ (TadC family)